MPDLPGCVVAGESRKEVGAAAQAPQRHIAVRPFDRLMGEATLMAVAVRKRPENPPVTYLHRQSL